MPRPSTLIYAAALALTVASDITSQIKAKKAAKLYITAYEAFMETEAANQAQISYLCHMLDQHDIPADEFDRIVLNFNH